MPSHTLRGQAGSARPTAIPQRVLIASGALGPELPAQAAAAAIARGLAAGGLGEHDLCLLEPRPGQDPRALLDALGFDARMRASRAVILAAERLREQTLAGSLAFEIATRARQAGVPAYAVTAHDELDRFDARILDLQVILQAATTRALSAAGRRLAALV